MFDVTKIVAYENGELGLGETLQLFADLIRTGAAWELQGSYGRAAYSYISNGLITRSGKITSRGHQFAEDELN